MMKTLILASALVLASGAAVADWEDVWQNPDLSVNHEGYSVSHQSMTQDPVEGAFPGDPNLYAGGSSEASSGMGRTSLDLIGRGNPDLDVCGCI